MSRYLNPITGVMEKDPEHSYLNGFDQFEGVSSNYFERNILNVHTNSGLEKAFAYTGGKFLREWFNNAPDYETVIVFE